MAWLFETAGLKVQILVGGYKAYRNEVLAIFDQPIPFRVLGGKTGSGKTEILHELVKRGHQVLDLEGIAHHRGSAFGHLGLAEQPTSEHFENEVHGVLGGFDYSREIWVEDESRHIGQVFMGAPLYNQLREAPVVFLDIEPVYRLPHLVNVYASYPKEDLATALGKIKKRLGLDRYAIAMEALEAGDFILVAEITLHYYDKAYMYGLEQREESKITRIEVRTLDPIEQTDQLLAYAT